MWGGKPPCFLLHKLLCDELEEEISDQDAIEEMKEQCGNTDLEDSIRQYKYLLEEYIENKKGE